MRQIFLRVGDFDEGRVDTGALQQRRIQHHEIIAIAVTEIEGFRRKLHAIVFIKRNIGIALIFQAHFTKLFKNGLCCRQISCCGRICRFLRADNFLAHLQNLFIIRGHKKAELVDFTIPRIAIMHHNFGAGFFAMRAAGARFHFQVDHRRRAA